MKIFWNCVATLALAFISVWVALLVPIFFGLGKALIYLSRVGERYMESADL